jgi:hypothetical protein
MTHSFARSDKYFLAFRIAEVAFQKTLDSRFCNRLKYIIVSFQTINISSPRITENQEISPSVITGVLLFSYSTLMLEALNLFFCERDAGSCSPIFGTAFVRVADPAHSRTSPPAEQPLMLRFRETPFFPTYFHCCVVPEEESPPTERGIHLIIEHFLPLFSIIGLPPLASARPNFWNCCHWFPTVFASIPKRAPILQMKSIRDSKVENLLGLFFWEWSVRQLPTF